MQSTLVKSLLGSLLAASALTACAPTPRLDASFGDAVNAAKAQQTINPDASMNTAPVAGVDGQSAKSIMDRYHGIHEAPSPAASGSIGAVSGAGTTLK